VRQIKILAAALLVFLPIAASAVPIVYTDESSYLAAIASFDSVSEGFETAGWVACTSGCTAVTNNGLTWTASDSIRANQFTFRSGAYGVFDSLGDPDAITVTNAVDTLVAAGGWFTAPASAPRVDFMIDATTVGSIDLGFPGFGFLGVVDTSGFSSIVFGAPTGHFIADDFTFARAELVAVPEPGTLALLGIGLFGMGVARRRKA